MFRKLFLAFSFTFTFWNVKAQLVGLTASITSSDFTTISIDTLKPSQANDNDFDEFEIHICNNLHSNISEIRNSVYYMLDYSSIELLKASHQNIHAMSIGHVFDRFIKANPFENETSAIKNRSYIKFKIKLKRGRRHLNGIANNFSFKIDKQLDGKWYHDEFMTTKSKSLIKKHHKELEVLNNCNMNELYNSNHLCLNLPRKSDYKLSTIQGEVLLKGTVQEEAINLGKLPVGVYLLEAWNLSEH